MAKRHGDNFGAFLDAIQPRATRAPVAAPEAPIAIVKYLGARPGGVSMINLISAVQLSPSVTVNAIQNLREMSFVEVRGKGAEEEVCLTEQGLQLAKLTEHN